MRYTLKRPLPDCFIGTTLSAEHWERDFGYDEEVLKNSGFFDVEVDKNALYLEATEKLAMLTALVFDLQETVDKLFEAK